MVPEPDAPMRVRPEAVWKNSLPLHALVLGSIAAVHAALASLNPDSAHSIVAGTFLVATTHRVVLGKSGLSVARSKALWAHGVAALALGCPCSAIAVGKRLPNGPLSFAFLLLSYVVCIFSLLLFSEFSKAHKGAFVLGHTLMIAAVDAPAGVANELKTLLMLAAVVFGALSAIAVENLLRGLGVAQLPAGAAASGDAMPVDGPVAAPVLATALATAQPATVAASATAAATARSASAGATSGRAAAPDAPSSESFERALVHRMQREVARGEAQLLDVRELYETANGYLRGAVLFPLSAMTADVPTPVCLDAATKMYIYCAAGIRVHPAKDVLVSRGFDAGNMVTVALGYKQLVAAGMPSAQIRGCEPAARPEWGAARCEAGEGESAVREAVREAAREAGPPRAKSPDETLHPSAAHSPGSSPASSSTDLAPSRGAPPARVLIVDDDEFFLASLYDMCTACGFAAQTCTDGEAALAIVHTSDRFDLCLIDVHMPGTAVSGPQVLRTFRAAFPPTTTLVMMSADECLEKQMLFFGADAFLHKPISMSAVHSLTEHIALRQCRSVALKPQPLAMASVVGSMSRSTSSCSTEPPCPPGSTAASTGSSTELVRTPSGSSAGSSARAAVSSERGERFRSSKYKDRGSERELARRQERGDDQLLTEELDRVFPGGRVTDLTAYDWHEELGRGTFATVVLLRERRTGQLVVAKQTSLQGMEGAELRRLVMEVRVQASLNHKHLIAVLGFHQEPRGRSFSLLMQYAPGGARLAGLHAARLAGLHAARLAGLHAARGTPSELPAAGRSPEAAGACALRARESAARRTRPCAPRLPRAASLS